MRLRIAVFSALLVAGLGASASFGEDAVLAEIYGRGVHAYFGGRYEEAESTLTDAIAQGSKDPRCYYFRGLTFFRLGKEAEATADFAAGAKEEVRDVALSTLASRSLERIQGGPRMLIEKARQTARKEHRAAQVTSDKARYEEWKSNEQRMLRTPPPPPAGEATKPAEPAKTEEVKPVEPAKEEAKPEAPPPPKPADPAAEDPFGNKPAAEPAKPAAEPVKPAEKPAEPAKDPFGG